MIATFWAVRKCRPEVGPAACIPYLCSPSPRRRCSGLIYLGPDQSARSARRARPLKRTALLAKPVNGINAPQRPDCVAGHVRLELRHVVAKYPFRSGGPESQNCLLISLLAVETGHGIDLEIDPVEAGLVESIARPGGNLTGLFLAAPSEVAAKASCSERSSVIRCPAGPRRCPYLREREPVRRRRASGVQQSARGADF
jgi:hypothetical protein